MKRIIMLILTVALCCCFGIMLVACNTEPNGTNPPITGGGAETPENPDEGTTTPVPASGNILVAYFSWSISGNTERMANYIADKTDATIYEIEPLVPYPTDYTETTEVALEEKIITLVPKSRTR